MAPGQTVRIGLYALRLDEVWARDEAFRVGVGTTLEVRRRGHLIGRVEPRQNYYPNRDEAVPTPAVLSTAANDLFVNLLAFSRDGSSATLHLVVRPLMVWLWIGTLVLAGGALVAMWPGPRRRAGAATIAPALAATKEVAA